MYRCRDDRFISVACLSPKLYRNLEQTLQLDPEVFSFRARRDRWPELRERLGQIAGTMSGDEWVDVFAGTGACIQPVLDMEEAPQHPHLVERGTFIEHGGVMQPAPAPRFSRSPSQISAQPPLNGADTDDVLADWGFSGSEISALRAAGTVGSRSEC